MARLLSLIPAPLKSGAPGRTISRDSDLDLPLGKLIVVSGPSGSGKSSLAFDTIYAEGQRRYVETFSPYTRQFMERMDKPKVDAIRGIPPAIAIEQARISVNPTRSTVGTMTEINDYLKLLQAARDPGVLSFVPAGESGPETAKSDLRSGHGSAAPARRCSVTFAMFRPRLGTEPEALFRVPSASGATSRILDFNGEVHADLDAGKNQAACRRSCM